MKSDCRLSFAKFSAIHSYLTIYVLTPVRFASASDSVKLSTLPSRASTHCSGYPDLASMRIRPTHSNLRLYRAGCTAGRARPSRLSAGTVGSPSRRDTGDPTLRDLNGQSVRNIPAGLLEVDT
jgi:hypothetical protein